MIKIATVIEAATITGPAQVLLEFYRAASSPQISGDSNPLLDPVIITFHRQSSSDAGHTSTSPNYFVATAREAGLKVEVIDERRRFDGLVIDALKSLMERYQPDIVETHHVKSHFLMRLSGLWKQRRWIAYHHGYTFTDAKMRLYNQLDRWSLRKASRIITVSQAAAQDLIRLGLPAERISALHNSINPSWAEKADAGAVEALKSRFNINGDHAVIVAVGRLSQEKGQIDLIHAFSQLLREKPALKARLILVGEGPEQAALEQTASELGVTGQVIFAGHTNDVRPFYTMATVMVLPSLSEGSPIALLEAMMSGLPIVATSVGGVPEIVTDQESALLVPSRQPTVMAQAIGKLLDNSKLAHSLGQNAQKVALTNHSPQAMLHKRMEIYRSVLAQNQETAH